MDELGPMIGVLGGMGPLATADFMVRLARLAKAERDQDHCRTLVYSNPRIPDRSAALLGQGASPLAGMIDGLGVLERSGADVIAIPCNTAHFWLRELASATAVPILSIIDAVGAELRRRGVHHGRVGLLATLGLTQSDVYQRGLEPSGYDVVTPVDEDREAVEGALRAVKAGHVEAAREPLVRAIRDLSRRDVQAVILGCTELPIALPEETAPCGTPLIDSTRCLAELCLAWISGTDAWKRTVRSPGLAEDVRQADLF